MKRPRNRLKSAAVSAALLFFIALTLASGGCASLERLSFPAGSPSPSPAPSPSPIAPAGTPQAMGTAAPTPFSVNPLYDFYRAYLAACKPAAKELLRALSARDSAEAFLISVEISAHLAALSEIGVTVCRLFGSGGSYAGAVQGAAEGTGEMHGSGEGGYTFSFDYADGAALVGEYAADVRASFSRGRYEYAATPEFGYEDEPEGSASPSPAVIAGFDAARTCAIEKTAEGWTSTVEENGTISTLVVTADAVAFICGGMRAQLAGGALETGPALTEATAAPSQ